MNARERRAIVALLMELGRIPFPKEGKGAAGQVSYSGDMRAAMPMVRNVLYALVDRGGGGESGVIYVDELFDTTGADKSRWPYARSCHLTGDTEAELHAFAARLGLRREWYQAHPAQWRCHYDLTATKRALAVKLGAIEVDAREQARKRLEQIV